MTKQTPRQIVDSQFGDRDKLIDALLPLLEAKDADTKRRLRSASNAKLLSLHEAGVQVRDRFRSRQELVTEIAARKFSPGKPDPAYAEKISGYSVKRLLDLHRQVSAR